MKQTLIALFFALITTGLNAQIFISPHKRALNRAQERNERALSEGADIVISPIESVPESSPRKLKASAAESNWGVNLVLPADVKARFAAELKYKVTLKVADTGKSLHAYTMQGQLPASNYTTDQSADDGHGHSTHVSGIVVGDQGLGVCDWLVDAGLVKHKQVKVLSNSGSGNFSWIQNALASERNDDRSRVNAGEFVVYNFSLGGGTGIVQAVENELRATSALGGVMFFAAAGNTGADGVNYPGNSQYCIAVASLDQSGGRSSFSTKGAQVWVAMPGRSINSTYKDNTFASLSGTSMATPFAAAAGIVALSKWGPKLKDQSVMRNYMAWCAKDILPAGKDNETGWGIELIKAVLDKDPADAPNMDNPPPPPPPPGPPAREPRVLSIPLPDQYAVYWYTGSASEASTFRTEGRGSRLKNRNLALNQTTIASITVAVNSTTDIGNQYKITTADAKWFFQNRGFQLASGSDDHDAVYWACYFYEMLLELQRTPKSRVDVVSVTAKDKTGAVFTIPADKLKHWPPQ